MLLIIAYLISNYYLIIGTFSDSAFISNRIEFAFNPVDYRTFIKKTDFIFRFGQYHAHSLHTYLIMPIVIAFAIRIYQKKWTAFAFLLGFIAITSVLYGLLNYGWFGKMYAHYFTLFPFQLQRFHFLHPMVWYILFALSIAF